MERPDFNPLCSDEVEEKILAKLEFEIQLAKQYLHVMEIAKPILESFKDNKITKMIANAIEKVLPEPYRVRYRSEYGMFHLNFWKSGTNGIPTAPDWPHDREISMLLGYDSDPYLREKYLFKETSTYYHPIRLAETIANYEVMGPEVHDLVQRYAQIFRDREAFEADAGPLAYWFPFNSRG